MEQQGTAVNHPHAPVHTHNGRARLPLGHVVTISLAVSGIDAQQVEKEAAHPVPGMSIELQFFIWGVRGDFPCMSAPRGHSHFYQEGFY